MPDLRCFGDWKCRRFEDLIYGSNFGFMARLCDKYLHTSSLIQMKDINNQTPVNNFGDKLLVITKDHLMVFERHPYEPYGMNHIVDIT